MKYQIIIEANSLIELHQKMKDELKVMTQQEDENRQMDIAIATKIPVHMRKHKQWTEFEENFLIDNYRKKKISWIAKALSRQTSATQQKLVALRKKYKLPNKNNIAKTLTV